MKHVITDKEMADISDQIEEEIADALTNVYDKLATRFNEDAVTSFQLWKAGESGCNRLLAMRNLALSLFRDLGLDLEGDGKGF